HLVSEMEYLFEEVIIIDKGKLVAQEDYETLVSRGASITGAAEAVDALVKGMEILSEQQLGNTKSVMIYGNMSDSKRTEAHNSGLEVGATTLQDLFIHLTKEDN
ncbi:MAG TPA: ABC transporter, partial [Clostridiales bacterium]|nr:ABC transporter [Clostridiales bacterium]